MTLVRTVPLRRSPMKRKPRTDEVTPERAAEVFARDGGCLAPFLGGSMMDCFGRLRIEHVKREARMGARGDLLGTLCEGHTETGMRGGYVWCTDRRNREAMRRHLLLVEDVHPHVDPMPGCATCFEVFG